MEAYRLLCTNKSVKRYFEKETGNNYLKGSFANSDEYTESFHDTLFGSYVKQLSIEKRLPIYPKERYEKDRFFLKHLEMEIALPSYVRARYYSNQPTLEDVIENPSKNFHIGKSSDEILEEITMKERKERIITSTQFVGGAVIIKSRDNIIYLNIILPSVVSKISKFGELGYLIHEFTCSHEEAHVLQYTQNYKRLVAFIVEHLGRSSHIYEMRRNPYLDEMYARAEYLDKVRNIWWIYYDLWKDGKTNVANRIYNKEEFKRVLETDADICAIANLVRKGMIKINDVDEILKPGFNFLESLAEKPVVIDYGEFKKIITLHKANPSNYT